MTFILRSTSKYLFLVACAVALLLPVHTFAQNSVSFTVSPTIFDMTANPGQSWQSTVRIINANPYDLPIFVEVVNFAPKGEGGTPQFFPVTAQTEPNSTLAQWITTEREIRVAAEQTIELPVKITVPPTAAPGGHFAALMIRTKPSDGPEGGEVQTAQVISSLIFLRVSGDISENSSIRSFRTTHYLLSKPEATFELRIENRGNVHVQPQGEIRIYNMWGQERGVIPVNQQTLFGNVLPSSVRKYSFTWNSEWSLSDIGRYRAVAVLTYGLDGKQSMSADAAFWIIPWKWLLLIVVVVGGFITFMTFAIKLYVRHMLRLAGITPGNHLPISPVERVEIATAKNGRKKAVSVVAPIEAGILDLRTRLNKTDTLKSYAVTIVSFVRTYWKFFTALVVVLIFLTLVFLFFKGAFTPSREFEVIIEGEGQSVTVSGEPSSASGGEQMVPEVSTTPDVLIKIVNRSGDESLTDTVKGIVEAEGKSVHQTSVDFGSIEERTVIVYTPEFANEALRLSTLLNNALLSAYIPENGATPELVIYVGSDIKSAQ